MLNHCICTTDIILEMVWANYHIVYLNKQCVTSNGLFAVDSTEWQIYSINRYQIIHKSFYYMLFHSCIREIFSKRFKWRIAHTHTHNHSDEMQYFVDLSWLNMRFSFTCLLFSPKIEPICHCARCSTTPLHFAFKWQTPVHHFIFTTTIYVLHAIPNVNLNGENCLWSS